MASKGAAMPPKKRRKVTAVLSCGHNVDEAVCVCAECAEEDGDPICMLCDGDTSDPAGVCDVDGCEKAIDIGHGLCTMCDRVFCVDHNDHNVGDCGNTKCLHYLCASCTFGIIDGDAICSECVWRCEECGSTPPPTKVLTDIGIKELSSERPFCNVCDKNMCLKHMRRCDGCERNTCDHCDSMFYTACRCTGSEDGDSDSDSNSSGLSVDYSEADNDDDGEEEDAEGEGDA